MVLYNIIRIKTSNYPYLLESIKLNVPENWVKKSTIKNVQHAPFILVEINWFYRPFIYYSSHCALVILTMVHDFGLFYWFFIFHTFPLLFQTFPLLILLLLWPFLHEFIRLLMDKVPHKFMTKSWVLQECTFMYV